MSLPIANGGSSIAMLVYRRVPPGNETLATGSSEIPQKYGAVIGTSSTKGEICELPPEEKPVHFSGGMTNSGHSQQAGKHLPIGRQYMLKPAGRISPRIGRMVAFASPSSSMIAWTNKGDIRLPSWQSNLAMGDPSFMVR